MLCKVTSVIVDTMTWKIDARHELRPGMDAVGAVLTQLGLSLECEPYDDVCHLQKGTVHDICVFKGTWIERFTAILSFRRKARYNSSS